MIRVKVTGIERELAKAGKDTRAFANRSLRARLFRVMGELKRVTPVDTGRARNSWLATQNKNEFEKTGSGGIPLGLMSNVSEDKIEQWYITNGVPYIKKLNEGSSKQAPARFIENTVLQNDFTIVGLTYVELGE